MGAGGQLDVEPLFERLEPTQRHTDAGISFACCNRFQQHFSGVAEVDQLDLQIVLFEEALAVGDHHRRQADRVQIDCKLQRARLIEADELPGARRLCCRITALPGMVCVFVSGPEDAG